MKSAEKPPAHPWPWRWNGPPGEDTALVDANGEWLIVYGNTSTLVVRDELRETIASAGEMEALLRNYLTLSAAVFGHADGCESCGVCLHCANAAILKRIDAAKADG